MEPKDPAAVCTLAADALVARLAWIRDEILPHARAAERLDAGLAWELADAPGLAEKLDRLIALERDCCSGIVFARVASATPGRIRLEIRGVDPDAPVFRTLGA
jgi:hypothetical protein